VINFSALIQKISKHIWVSHWFIPTLISMFMSSAAFATLIVDQSLPNTALADVLFLGRIEPGSAQALLSTIAGSIIGVAGVVFSITMVAVSFASGTFGPRLIGNFMRDRGNQVSLGVFIGSFIYTLLILREVRKGDPAVDTLVGTTAFVPHVSVTTSLGLAIICMGFLIYFIHHVPETINIERIIARLGTALRDGVTGRFPQSIPDGANGHSSLPAWDDIKNKRSQTEIKCAGSGYIQTIDLSILCNLAKKHDLFIRLLERPGAFVTTETCVMHIWHNADCSDSMKQELSACLATGDSQTISQNVEFVADQLIEIIARALSPGTNDPFTAIACINWLQIGILTFARDEQENPRDAQAGRIAVTPLCFDEFVTTVFDKSLPYIRTDQNVLNHTQDIMKFIAETVETPDQQRTVKIIINSLKKQEEAP